MRECPKCFGKFGPGTVFRSLGNGSFECPHCKSDITLIITRADDHQVGGDHYKKHKITPWMIIEEYGLDFFEGSALKYLLRRKHNRLEDLKKLLHYVQKAIEREETNANTK